MQPLMWIQGSAKPPLRKLLLDIASVGLESPNGGCQQVAFSALVHGELPLCYPHCRQMAFSAFTWVSWQPLCAIPSRVTEYPWHLHNRLS